VKLRLLTDEDLSQSWELFSGPPPGILDYF
jgi:hypothetical protein